MNESKGSLHASAFTALETSLTIDTYIFDAMYTLLRTHHSELAIGGGFHVLDNDAMVNSRHRVNDNETAEVERCLRSECGF